MGTEMTKEIVEKAKEILKKGYARRLTPDESGGFVATILEFPGCIAEGETPGEAYSNLNESAESWVIAALETGYPIREPINLENCSGKIALRIPKSLHKQAIELAELENCSLNQLLTTAVAHYISAKSVQTKNSNVVSMQMFAFKNSNLLECAYSAQGNIRFDKMILNKESNLNLLRVISK